MDFNPMMLNKYKKAKKESTQKRVAWLDYEPAFVEAYQLELKRDVPGVSIDHYTDEAAFMHGVGATTYDVIIMEPFLPPPKEVRCTADSDVYGYGLEQLMKVKAGGGQNKKTPLFILSNIPPDELESKCRADYQKKFVELGVKSLWKPQTLPFELVEAVMKYLKK